MSAPLVLMDVERLRFGDEPAPLVQLETEDDVTDRLAWERDVLALAEMELDHEAAELTMDDHIYFSREASAGGRAFGGGGCGCN